MNRVPRRALGALSNWLAFAATLAVSFVMTPYLIRALGFARYDVWCVVESVLAYLTLLDLGIAVCLVRHVARSNATADDGGLNRMAATCLAVFTGAGGVAFALGAAVLVALSGRLEANAGHPGDVLAFMLVMLLNLAVSLPLSVFPAILDGLERYPEKSAVRVVALATRTGGVVVAVEHGGGLVGLGVAVCAVSVAEQLVLALLCFRALPGLSVRPRHVDRATLRLVRTSSADAFLAMLAGRVTGEAGKILAGLMLPPGSVTAFANAGRLVDYSKTLLRNVTTTLTPGVSALEARGDWAGVRSLYLTATRWVLYAALPLNVGLVWFGRPFLARWLGPDLADASYPAAAVLAVTLALGMAQSVASRVLYGLGRLRVFSRLALAEAAVMFALSLLLVGPLGVVGLAVGVAVANVLFSLAVLVVTRHVLGCAWRDYFAAWLKPVVAGLVPVGVWVALGPTAAAWPDLLLAGAAGMVPYVFAVLVMEAPRGLTRRVFSVARPLRERSRPTAARSVGRALTARGAGGPH